ncbi:hypothetical protein E4T44_00377 [Aureobasidium sp. EXF-8845]|nr:hypothetical protein E4T44_00377 [Aureobasidium sp. EXF-8845]KAI4858079.1 hypothetical protein E4T45_00404 [Aureobasidium sp. EXF-8846]
MDSILVHQAPPAIYPSPDEKEPVLTLISGPGPMMSSGLRYEGEFRRLSWLWAYCYDNKVGCLSPTSRGGEIGILTFL